MDEVIFVVNTGDQDDLEYLDQIVNGTEGYKKHVQQKKLDGWTAQWEVVERSNLYIKIDGELCSIRDMVASNLRRDEVFGMHGEETHVGCSQLLRLHSQSFSRVLVALTWLSDSNRSEGRDLMVSQIG